MRIHILTALLVVFATTASAENAEVWPVLGLFTVSSETPVPDGFAEAITQELLPAAAWIGEHLPYAEAEHPKAYLIDYGAKGKLITIDRWMSLKPNVRFAIHIERPASVPLRHKIMIGTDKSSWRILKRSPVSPIAGPFQRTYLLQHRQGGAVFGAVFYEGVWATIEWPTPSSKEQVQALERITWTLAKNLREKYSDRFFALANSLEDGRPVVTRPDLPDPDSSP